MEMKRGGDNVLNKYDDMPVAATKDGAGNCQADQAGTLCRGKTQLIVVEKVPLLGKKGSLRNKELLKSSVATEK